MIKTTDLFNFFGLFDMAIHVIVGQALDHCLFELEEICISCHPVVYINTVYYVHPKDEFPLQEARLVKLQELGAKVIAWSTNLLQCICLEISPQLPIITFCQPNNVPSGG